ncbi:MAG: LptE family protein [Sedimentisphaerales bacterium]
MKNYSTNTTTIFFCCCALGAFALILEGCSTFAGYSNESIFPENVKTVSVKMFDNQTFRRGVEYELSDALAKRIETDTPYKIVTSEDYADSVITGRILNIGEAALTMERLTGHVLEKEVGMTAVVNWKDLKTGELLIDNLTISSSASYSEYQNQDFQYGSSLAANNLALNIVEHMEKSW